MRSLNIFNRRAGSVFAAAAIVLSTAVPGLASAATITTRSIEMSSSTKSATGVKYHVVFTSASDTKDFVLDFCDSPALNTTCNAPAGLSVSLAGTSTSGYTETGIDGNTTAVTLTAAGKSIDMELTGVTNPNTDGVFYARVTTYAGAHDYTNATSLGSVVDSGTVALSTAQGFSVGGAVDETLTFCASGSDDADCSAPSPIDISLGTDGVLDTEVGTDGDVYTLIATNASGGAVVNLKSDAAGCGGLYRDGVSDATHCGIAPITTAGALATGAAQFGAKLTLEQPSAGGSLAADTGWSDTNYFMPYVVGDATGVTSVYGAKVYDTDDAPTTLGGGKLSFNANRSDLTPAGSYKANFSLIATGTF